MSDANNPLKLIVVNLRVHCSRGILLLVSFWILLSAACGSTAAPPSPTLAAAPEPAHFVSVDGSDTNPGTLAQPFRTIQNCALAAQPGDTCFIRAGVYRETITPPRSGGVDAPVTFQPYNEESVTIDGADPVLDWTRFREHIYRAPVGWDLGAGKNQVFVDGQMMPEARFPNTTLDPSHPILGHASAGESHGNIGIIRDPMLTQPGGYWQGARIWFAPSPVWVAQTSTVLSSVPGSLTFNFDPAESFSIGAGNPYYLTGTLNALDSPGEWYLDAPTHTLYLWLPAGDSPSAHHIEVKHRRLAFDLSHRAFVRVDGLKLFAAAITTDGSSHHLTLDHLDARYLSHFSVLGAAMWDPHVEEGGIVLRGHDNALQNSAVAYSAGSGVTLSGAHQIVFNNLIHDINYTGTDTGAVYTDASDVATTQHDISYNTFYNSARSLIVHRNLTAGKILHNDLFDYGLLVTDLGATYTWGTDGGGNEIAYNLVHDSFAVNPFDSIGIYLDNGSSHYSVHHNVVWNVPNALNLNLPSLNNQILNNTLVGNSNAITSWGERGQGMSGTILKNNILINPAELASDVVQTNNLPPNTDPQFKDWGGNDFQLKSTSPAIDAGVPLLQVTQGFVGKAPDLGAYEFGATPWRAGSTLATGILPTPVLFDANAHGKVVTLRWGKVANAIGYRVHYGISPDALTTTLDAGNTTDFKNLELAGARYLFAITAYTRAAESSLSNLKEVRVPNNEQ